MEREDGYGSGLENRRIKTGRGKKNENNGSGKVKKN
jgi:hypothetical protein